MRKTKYQKTSLTEVTSTTKIPHRHQGYIFLPPYCHILLVDFVGGKESVATILWTQMIARSRRAVKGMYSSEEEENAVYAVPAGGYTDTPVTILVRPASVPTCLSSFATTVLLLLGTRKTPKKSRTNPSSTSSLSFSRSSSLLFFSSSCLPFLFLTFFLSSCLPRLFQIQREEKKREYAVRSAESCLPPEKNTQNEGT